MKTREHTNPYYFLGMYFGTVRRLVSDKDMREFQDGIVWYINRNLPLAWVRVIKWIDNHNLYKRIKKEENGQVFVTTAYLARFYELGGEVVKVMSDRDACEFWLGYDSPDIS